MIEELLFKAIIIGFLVSIPLSFMSYFVVMRKMTFSGVGIAHSAFGGIALGILFGINSFLFPVVFCLMASLFIGFMFKKGGFSEDSVIDVIFVFSMALGIFILSISKQYYAGILGILFGDILSVASSDILTVFFVFLLGSLFVWFLFDHLNLITYNEELAKVNGIKTNVLYYVFWAVLSVIIVFSIKLIGIILVNAFLVLPTLIGLNVSKNYKGVIFVGSLSSVISVTAGVLISYFLNTPAGATIVLFFVVLWLLSFIFKVG